jgi:hypothetical protein
LRSFLSLLFFVALCRPLLLDFCKASTASRSLSLRGFSVSPLSTRKCGSPIEMDGFNCCGSPGLWKPKAKQPWAAPGYLATLNGTLNGRRILHAWPASMGDSPLQVPWKLCFRLHSQRVLERGRYGNGVGVWVDGWGVVCVWWGGGVKVH